MNLEIIKQYAKMSADGATRARKQYLKTHKETQADREQGKEEAYLNIYELLGGDNS